jgi:hypothetical protein
MAIVTTLNDLVEAISLVIAKRGCWADSKESNYCHPSRRFLTAGYEVK